MPADLTGRTVSLPNGWDAKLRENPRTIATVISVNGPWAFVRYPDGSERAVPVIACRVEK